MKMPRLALILLAAATGLAGCERAASPSGSSGAPSASPSPTGPWLKTISSNAGVGSSFAITVPPSAEPGDVLVASILALPSNDEDRVATPDGWTYVRNTQHNWLYVHAVTGPEPPAYNWTYEQLGPKETMGVIMVFGGVDPEDPVESSSGLFLNQDRLVNTPGNGTPVASILAPSVDVDVPGSLVLYSAACHTRSIDGLGINDIVPPPGMTEITDLRDKGEFELAYLVKPDAGPTGDLVGSSNAVSIHAVGSLVALRPAAHASPT